MSTIDFSATDYTVKSPGNGKTRRYEGVHWEFDINQAQRTFEELEGMYPALGALIVPDHFVQEFCRSCDSAAWSGTSFNGELALFLELANRGASQAKSR
jgi:hypothetical protein